MVKTKAKQCGNKVINGDQFHQISFEPVGNFKGKEYEGRGKNAKQEVNHFSKDK